MILSTLDDCFWLFNHAVINPTIHANFMVQVLFKLYKYISFSDDFLVLVVLHQGSVLTYLSFIIVLEALSREMRSICSGELLYADNLTLISESLDDLKEVREAWKGAL